MNTLLLTFAAEHDSTSGEIHLRTVVRVDAKPLVDYGYYGLATNLGALLDSTKGSGEFFIITCACGDPSCAGIQQGISVTHRDNRILWAYRNPLPDPIENPELVRQTPSGRPEWVVRGARLPTRTYIFETSAYRAAIQQGINRGRQLLKQYDTQHVSFLPDYNSQFIATYPPR